MKFHDNIIKIAMAPHLKSINYGGKNGFWIKNNLGYNLFIDKNTNKIWLPMALRGQNPDKVSPDIFKSLTPDENGSKDYSNWLKEHRNLQESDKIHDGYGFTEKGKQLVNRLKNFLVKNNIDSGNADKLLEHTDVDKVRQTAKTLAKKYRTHIEELKTQNHPDSDRIDKEFNSNWNKLNPLFQFNPNDYNPKIDTPEEVKIKSIKDCFKDFVQSAAPFIDVQMSEIEEILKALNKAILDDKIDLIKKAWNLLNNALVSNINNHLLSCNW